MSSAKQKVIKTAIVTEANPVAGYPIGTRLVYFADGRILAYDKEGNLISSK